MGEGGILSGKGGAGKVGDIPQIGQLANLANSFLKKMNFLFKTAKPLVAESSAQKLEALKTGGVGAKIPMIQRAVEASKQATANSLQGSRDELASLGIGATPFAGNILASTRMAGEQTASQIPIAIAQDTISGGTTGLDAIQASLGYGQAGGSALTKSLEAELGRREFNINKFAQFEEDIKQSFGGGASGGGGGGGGGAFYGGGMGGA